MAAKAITPDKGTAYWLSIPVAQDYSDLYADYGDPSKPGFEGTYIQTFRLPLAGGGHQDIRTHVAMIPRLIAVVKQAGQYIKTCAGSYNYREVRGGTHLSLHSWGLAIDINADQFPLGSDLRQAHQLTVAFEGQGFFYGGDYHHRKDPMHYQLAGDF